MCVIMWVFLLLIVSTSSFSYDWQRLHSCVTVQELVDTVADYKENFPCLDCREHFQSLLEMHPFPLDYVQTPKDVLVFSWLTHNLVNIRLNKTWQSFDIMEEYIIDEGFYFT